MMLLTSGAKQCMTLYFEMQNLAKKGKQSVILNCLHLICTTLAKAYNVFKVIHAGAVNLWSWKRYQGFLEFHEVICLKTN